MSTFEIEALRTTRNNVKRAISKLTNEELNKIPAGFNNSIMWNVGHIVVTQQLLHYKLSGLTPKVSEELINRYKKGSVPTDHYADDNEIEEIKSLLTSTIDQLESDISAAIFKEFQTYETSYGVTLSSFDQALYFVTVHEGLHLGYIMALCKAI